MPDDDYNKSSLTASRWFSNSPELTPIPPYASAIWMAFKVQRNNQLVPPNSKTRGDEMNDYQDESHVVSLRRD
jgi:hypothetical protein